MRNKIVILIEGGMVQEVRTSKPDETDVYIIDVDILKEEGKSETARAKKYERTIQDTESIEWV